MGKLKRRLRPDAEHEFPPSCSIDTGVPPCFSWVPTCSRRRVSPTLSVALLLTLTACTRIEQGIEPYLIREWAEVWFAISFFFWLVIGLLIVAGLLWRALSKWNLEDGGPRMRPAFYTLVVFAILCPVAFALMNVLWDGPIPPEQRLWNSFGWASGSVLGAIGAWQGGKHLIARQYQKKFPVQTRENS